jgi:hypothetical protein
VQDVLLLEENDLAVGDGNVNDLLAAVGQGERASKKRCATDEDGKKSLAVPRGALYEAG